MYFIARRKIDRVSDRGTEITSAAEALKVFGKFADEERECFWALFLDSRRRALKEPYLLSLGTMTTTLVHPRELFSAALEAKAIAMIVCHNHPSGDPTPSADDFAMTDRLVQAGSLMGIEVLDHLIIARDGYRSLRALGRIGCKQDETFPWSNG